MGKKKSYTRITEKDFRLIKGLLENGFSAVKIHKLTGRSTSTVALIKKSENIQEYKSAAAESWLSYGHKDDKGSTAESPSTSAIEQKPTKPVNRTPGGTRKAVTKRDFRFVKMLLDGGLSSSKVKKITGRGWGTISLIKQSKNHNQYKEAISEKSRLARAKRDGQESQEAPEAQQEDRRVDPELTKPREAQSVIMTEEKFDVVIEMHKEIFKQNEELTKSIKALTTEIQLLSERLNRKKIFSKF